MSGERLSLYCSNLNAIPSKFNHHNKNVSYKENEALSTLADLIRLYEAFLFSYLLFSHHDNVNMAVTNISELCTTGPKGFG